MVVSSFIHIRRNEIPVLCPTPPPKNKTLVLLIVISIVFIVGVVNTSQVKLWDLPICSPRTFRENHSPNIIYTVNRRNQPTAMDLYFLD